MVVEDYPPFLISGIYLQDVDLIDYPHHGPLGFFFFFFGPTLEARMLYWAYLSFGAQWMGLRIAPTFKPHQ